MASVVSDIVHPGWVRHRPGRSRTPRDGMVAMRSRIEVPVREASDFEPVLSLKARFRTAPAAILRDASGFWEIPSDRRGGDLSGAAARAFLAGEAPTGIDLRAVLRVFSGTPFLAWDEGAWKTGRVVRGMDPECLGEILEDRRPAAHAEAASHARGNVAFLADGRLAVRVRPVIRSNACAGIPLGGGWRLDLRRKPHAWQSVYAGSATSEATLRARDWRSGQDRDEILRWLGIASGHPDPDADVAAFVNDHAAPLEKVLNGAIMRLGAAPERQAALLRARDAIAPLARRSLVGLAGADDPAAALDVLLRAAEAFAQAAGPCARDEDGRQSPSNLRREAALHYGGRLRAMLDARADDDLASIGMLAP